eukprot:TRINITY_DN861_c0_g1_i1.p1 TRINITY_DN861_c0_g1~~TRINITY_DN861_c0_g1_i1.p1  ORF type:complete len:715 (-),score=150.75 TRINITY_DN861_c0_g1_i1:24-2168(-)
MSGMFQVSQLPSSELAYTNLVYISTGDFDKMRFKKDPLVVIKNHVFGVAGIDQLDAGTLAVSSLQRSLLLLSNNESVLVEKYKPSSEDAILNSITFKVEYVKKRVTTPLELDGKKLDQLLKASFSGQYLHLEQSIAMDVHGKTLTFTIIDLQKVSFGESKKSRFSTNGVFMEDTIVTFNQADSPITVKGVVSQTSNIIFRPDFNFEQLGIGGLDEEFGQIFRRAFASRVFPSDVVQKLGVKHVRGMLLHGPPGTGKTLIARQIGKMLNAREPKIINGPEVLNKFVGQSEENIRNLFVDAEAEYAEKGDNSQLHIIIFDELDAICKERGSRSSGGTGVGDSIVNQLLSKMDGVNQLNNILVIGMTNRKDMIDDALLRPGRLEVHMEIGLPDEHGRIQILNIHTEKMRTNGYMDKSVNINELSKLTKNYTGAEIEGLVKSATSFALNRQVDASNPTKPLDPEKVTVIRSDFINALNEVRPAFGVSDYALESAIRNGFVRFSEDVENLYNRGHVFIEQLKDSSRSDIVSLLLFGEPGCGKTAFAAKLAKDSGFPLIRIISPEEYVGMSESAKVSKLVKTFRDAYKSPLSMIILDDIERFLDYISFGHRFSNAILQTLFVLLKQRPENGHKVMIIGTTTEPEILKEMGFDHFFSAKYEVPLVKGKEQIKTVLDELEYTGDISKVPDAIIPIKQLILVTDLAEGGRDFVECFDMLGINY